MGKMGFHHLESKSKISRVIDAHQLKPIVDAMGLDDKPIEEKIFSLASFTAMPLKFGRPEVADADEYASTYSSIALDYNEGNCRHRAAMFSALLEAAGIGHEIRRGSNGAHPYVHIQLPNEHIQIDFNKRNGNPYTGITIKNGATLHSWELYENGVIKHDIMGLLHGELDDDDIAEVEQLPEFEKGMNRLILEKIKKRMCG